MKTLVIAPQPFFQPRGTPLSAYYRALVMAEMGVEADLLTYGEGEDVTIPGLRIVRIPRFPFLGPVRIGPSLLKLFLDVFIAIWATGLLLRHRYDFVHAHEEGVFIATLLKPLFRFPLVYDMHSSLPEQLSNFRFTRSRLLIRLFEKLEAWSLRSADAVITISPGLAEYAISRMPDTGKHILIENSIFDPIELRDRAPDPEPQLDLSIFDGRPVVAYAGNFEVYQGIELLLAAFPEVLRGRPDAFLLLIGGTPRQVEQSGELARRLGVDEACHFTGIVSHDSARGLLKRSAVVTSPSTVGRNAPLKIYELLTIGVPLVATRVAAHTQVLNEDVSLLADPEPSELAAVILSALNDAEGSARTVAAARALYERKYSRRVYEQRIGDLLELLH